MKRIRAVLSLLIAAALFWGLNGRHGVIPPAGKLFNPFAGFWQNGAKGDSPPESLVVPGLKAEVQVVWEERRVPHIFAADEHDLFLAQGYITARDRLWQMETMARFAAGRMSEVVGASGVEQDRYNRRLGMPWAAERATEVTAADPTTKASIDAYTEGVNAWIEGLERRTLPVEYKILDYVPEPWTAVKCALLLKYMAYDLTGYSEDAWMTSARDNLGESLIDKLFPFDPPLIDPIIPPGTPWDLSLKAAPWPADGADSASRGPAAVAARNNSSPAKNDDLENFSSREVGSNNWAVSGKLTRSGFPILCNDPHLSLTLPSIWYEIQLNAPGINVSGVSLPGSPLVVIGHNERIAWGVTNAGSDVLDWYAIKFKDQSRGEYSVHDQWLKTSVRVEEIKVRGGRTTIDRVLYTHHGPVVRRGDEPPLADPTVPRDAALRWAAHDPSNEFLTLYKLNRAQNYEGYLEAIRLWDCPAQNFIYADVEGNIAIWHNGKFPLRQKGQGRYLLDGSNPADEWRDRVPAEDNPHVKNPERGFVSSANQKPADATYPYYLGWDYAAFERGSRINSILGGFKDITPQDMIRMQNDNLSLRARLALPPLLKAMGSRDFTNAEKRCLEELGTWNFENLAGTIAPTVFQRYWLDFNGLVWNDEKKGTMTSMTWPASEVVIDLLLNDPQSEFFDDRATPGRESLGDIAFRAFRSAIEKLSADSGPPGEAWTWGRWRGTNIRHLARIPGLGREKLQTNGGSGIINATGLTGGPSWRMVIALGPEVKAWGIGPGGESGNPGSRYYDNGVDDWMAGKAYELIFLKSPQETRPGIIGTTTLGGGK